MWCTVRDYQRGAVDAGSRCRMVRVRPGEEHMPKHCKDHEEHADHAEKTKDVNSVGAKQRETF